jgi:AraC-like DNA-binding protein
MRVIRLLDLAAARGVDRGSLLEAAGLADVDLDDPDDRVPLRKIFWLWKALAEADSDPDLGIELGRRVEVREAGVLGYALAHSTTLGDALHRYQRFGRLVSTAFELDLETDSRTWLLCVRRPPLQPRFRQPIDEALAGFVTIVREITGRRIDPLEIALTYPRPVRLSALRDLFRCDLRFEQPRISVSLSAEHAGIPLVASDSRLTRYLDRLAEQELAALPRADTFARRVGRAAWQRLSEGQPTVGQLADELGVSSRTLQRRLREEGTSFAQVLEDLRRQLAPVLLRDDSLAVYEVAYLLGYSDPSAFFRAFRRWHGVSPADYRRRRP